MHRFELHGSSVVIHHDLAPFRQMLEELYCTLWPQSSLPRPSRLAILSDENTKKHCLPKLLKVLPEQDIILFDMPAGEKAKNLENCKLLWRQMLDAQLDRHALLIVLGGGVPGDLGGFCAATYMRGIPFVFLPTSLLAQTDASIGGKLGIDFEQTKNIIGLFRQPDLVFIWPGFLQTLPHRQKMSGWAEVVKHALIGRPDLWKQIRATQPADLSRAREWLIPSIEVKCQIVEKDPHEGGLRKMLNFGHTIGHALESLRLGTSEELLHGEAIAIGMACEAELSHQLGLLPKKQWEDIRDYLSQHYALQGIQKTERERFVRYLLRDKKNRSGKVRLALIGPIGQGQFDLELPVEQLVEAAALP